MEVIADPLKMSDRAEELRGGGKLALVPTMGALHDGHLALISEAVGRAERVIVSIFVNPTQFGPDEDFNAYPRPFGRDRKILERLGSVDCLFAPSKDAMYSDDNLTRVTVDKLDEHLCGAHRPGHFEGVATVVSKLFNVCRPHLAVFGQKDAQQLIILRRMARDLFFGIEVVGAPIVREPDGLAISSRNAYLSDQQRAQSPVLHEAVTAAREAVLQGEQASEAVVQIMQEIIARASEAQLQYAEVVSADTLQPVVRMKAGENILVALAVYFGRTRLIDNSLVEVPTRV